MWVTRLAAKAEPLNGPVKTLSAISTIPSYDEVMTFPRQRGFRLAPFMGVGLFLLVLTILPGHAIARCFGVPEGLGAEPGANAWFLSLDIETGTGFQERVTLGFHENATDGFDGRYDQLAQPFDFRAGGEEFGLVAYFTYPENDPGSFENDPSTSRLRISTIQPRLDMAWPLRIAYLFDQDTQIELRWNTSEARDLEGFEVSLHVPFGPWIDLGEESSFTFNASLGIHWFSIDAHGEPGSLPAEETPVGDTLVLVASFAAYGAVIAIVLGLRWMKRRQA